MIVVARYLVCYKKTVLQFSVLQSFYNTQGILSYCYNRDESVEEPDDGKMKG